MIQYGLLFFYWSFTEAPCYSVTVGGVECSYSVVSSLVLIVDPVEGFHRAILNAVLGRPFISVTATLGEDSWHDPYFLQVNLEPLVLVVKLGEPGAPKTICVTQLYNNTTIYNNNSYLFIGIRLLSGGKKSIMEYPKPWLLRRAFWGIQEEYQPPYWSWLEQLIWSDVTDPASKPRALW